MSYSKDINLFQPALSECWKARPCSHNKKGPRSPAVIRILLNIVSIKITTRRNLTPIAAHSI